MTVTELARVGEADPHRDARVDLAAAFRWTARLDMHEGIANHFSLAVGDDGQFLINPYGLHFSRIRASDLILLDANQAPEGLGDAIDPTAWAIHGAVHRALPQARCFLHVHPHYATTLAALKDSSMPPIDQNTMRFHGRIAVDDGFDGMGLGDEAERMVRSIGNRSVLLMGNHGVATMGRTVAEAFDLLFYFERACRTLITALSTGRALRVVPPAVAEKTAQQWENYGDFADRHLAALKVILDHEEPDYRN